MTIPKFCIFIKPFLTTLGDGTKLAELMIEHNFDVSVKKSFEIKAIDMDVLNDYADK